MSGSQLQVRLYRDSFNTPWGFRLQGGRDLGQPLSIQRVFSNSPAEGELQRGDLILAISNRNGNELTHKQALDLIKHGGGQIQLVIQRPAPGRVVSSTTTTTIIKPQRPRAPTLQVDKLRENETPSTEAYIRFHLERLRRLKNGENENSELSPVYPTMPGPGGQRPLHLNPCYNPNFLQQNSPHSPGYPPPWAIQTFAPKKVSKLSRLGGGALDFVVDYGSHYGTLPRRRHSTQVSSSSHLFGAGSNPGYSLSELGGGGYDFGTDYCTLPRKSPRHASVDHSLPRQPTRQSSQPPTSPHHTMPASQISYGFQPKKVTLSSLGGGGPCFGSDFTSSRAPVTQPVHVHTGGRGADMLNRVQTSLDNISLSPRTPDYGYQAAPFSTSPVAPSGGYIPTGVRLDMEREREEELRRQQQQQQYQQPPPQQYHYEPPQQHFTPQPAYVPTGIRLEQQMGETADEPDAVPVWERRRTFMNAPSKPAAPPTGKMNAPKVPRPKSGQGPFTGFGVDYSKPAPKTSSVTWRPSRPAQTPVNAPQVQMAPAPWRPQQQQGDQTDAPPAWRHTLKTTGVKQWDSDLQYTASQQEAPRSVGFQPGKAPGSAPYNPAPVSPGGGMGGGAEADGPQVVHLQYNSPMGLYSRENVQETFAGQTHAMAAAGLSPGGGASAQNPQKEGDRDWTQSAVYRMIYEEEHRGPRGVPQQQQQQYQQQQQQQQQQQRAPAPPPKPKPQSQFQQSFPAMDEEFGTSDF